MSNPRATPAAPAEAHGIALADLLARIGTVLHAMGRDGHGLQEAVSPALARAVLEDPALLVALQGLDALTQRAEALAGLAEALGRAAEPGWRVPEGPVAAIRLADLRAALGGTAPALSDPDDDEDWSAPFDAWPGEGWSAA